MTSVARSPVGHILEIEVIRSLGAIFKIHQYYSTVASAISSDPIRSTGHAGAADVPEKHFPLGK
jgi:hypothetical protein